MLAYASRVNTDIWIRARHPEDVITLSKPEDGTPCFSRTCQGHQTPAFVTVTFGVLPGLWRDSWGCAYDMCAPCWDRTRATVQEHRPGLIVEGIRT
jgi:hypothetical protein